MKSTYFVGPVPLGTLSCIMGKCKIPKVVFSGLFQIAQKAVSFVHLHGLCKMNVAKLIFHLCKRRKSAEYVEL